MAVSGSSSMAWAAAVSAAGHHSSSGASQHHSTAAPHHHSTTAPRASTAPHHQTPVRGPHHRQWILTTEDVHNHHSLTGLASGHGHGAAVAAAAVGLTVSPPDWSPRCWRFYPQCIWWSRMEGYHSGSNAVRLCSSGGARHAARIRCTRALQHSRCSGLQQSPGSSRTAEQQYQHGNPGRRAHGL